MNHRRITALIILALMLVPLFTVFIPVQPAQAATELTAQRYDTYFADYTGGGSGEKMSWSSGIYHNASGSAKVVTQTQAISRNFFQMALNLTSYLTNPLLTLSFWFRFDNATYDNRNTVVNFAGLCAGGTPAYLSYRYFIGQNRIEVVYQSNATVSPTLIATFNSTGLTFGSWYSADIIFNPVNYTIFALYFDARQASRPSGFPVYVPSPGTYFNWFRIGDLSNGADSTGRVTGNSTYYIDDIVLYSGYHISNGAGGGVAGPHIETIAKATFDTSFNALAKTIYNEIIMWSGGEVFVNTTYPAFSRQHSWSVMPLVGYEDFEDVTISFDVRFTNYVNVTNRVVNFAGGYSGTDQMYTWRVDNNWQFLSLLKDNTVGAFTVAMVVGQTYHGQAIVNLTSPYAITSMKLDGSATSAGIPQDLGGSILTFKVGDLSNGCDAVSKCVTTSTFYIDNIYVTALVNAPELPNTQDVDIDTDFDPYLFVNKFYTANTSTTFSGPSNIANIDTVSLKFSDNFGDIVLNYCNETDTFSTTGSTDGYVVLELHSSSANSTVVGVDHTVTVNFIFKLTNLVQDVSDVDLYMKSNTSAGADTGWVLLHADYFSIYNHGGIVESLKSGDAGRVQGGDTFEMWAKDGGWVAVNQTWYHLVQYHTQFAIEFSGGSDSNDQFMQDCGHYFLPSDKWCSDKGDWQLFISWYYFDQTNMSNKGYVKGWTAWIQMETGNTNQNNHWISLNVTWFDSQGATVRSDLVWSYAEPPESNQVKIWLDLWFNKINASTVHGGRVSPVYYGMTFGGFLWWGTFAPLMQNSTQSMLFDENIGRDNTTIIPSQFLEMSKVMFNLTRPTSNILAEDMKVTLKNFDISEFKTTDGRVLGIDTPIYVYPKIPDLPVEGFFAPLYKAISMIGQYIQDALADGMKVIWDGIAVRWPWFTDFWNNMVGSITAIAGVFNAIWTYVVSFFVFLGSIIGYISYPFQVLAQAWSYVQQMFGWVSGADLSNLLIIFIIIFTFIPILQALYAGNWDFIIGFASRIWAIASAIFSIFTTVVKIVIDFVMDLIPT